MQNLSNEWVHVLMYGEAVYMHVGKKILWAADENNLQPIRRSIRGISVSIEKEVTSETKPFCWK